MSENLEEKAQKLLEEKDADARIRSYTGVFKNVLIVLLIIWTIFQINVNTFGILQEIIEKIIKIKIGILGAMSAMDRNIWHCMFLLVFTFLLYPTYKSEPKKRLFPPIWDFILVILSIFVFGYILYNFPKVAQRGGFLKPNDYRIAGLGIILVFLAAKRAAPSLCYLAFAFLLYNFLGKYIPGTLGHGGMSIKRVLSHMMWGSQGILGTGIDVSATYIFIFVLFGAFLKHSGFSQFINDLSLTLVGKSSGGPAKVAVIASGLLGMINGSAIANVATTGTITIPLMKKTGYTSEFAGAVEAVASTGGQFAPPIMGAVGFVMAEFLADGGGYRKVMIAASIPAFLYYFSLLLAVHFEAKKLGLKGLSPEHIPNAIIVMKKGGHLIIPLIVLMTLIFIGRTPLYAGVWATFATVAASWLKKDTHMGFTKIRDAIVEGAQSAVGVGISCVIIGIIIGTVSLTSLGINMGNIILSVVGKDQLYLGGIMVMIMSIILGMGVPGVAAYVIVAAVAIPLLTEIGVIPIAAHMFCLIYACLSNITPPVAMSSYVASGIANSDQTKTSLIAVKLGLTGFLVPFFFLDNPILLIGAIDVSIYSTIIAVITATLGVAALTAALEGMFIIRCSIIDRILLLVAAVCTISPEPKSDVVGILIMLLIIIFQYTKLKNERRSV